MFPTAFYLSAAAALTLTAGATAALTFDDVLVAYWTGQGANEAMMIVDWQDDRALGFGYRWDDLDAPTDFDLFEAVNVASDRFYRQWVDDMPEQAIFGIGWDADDDGFAKTDPDDWYEEGWFENGFWSQWISADGEAWDWGGGLGTVDLMDGDWIGWSWAPNFDSTPPDVPLIPAPGALALLGLGAVVARRRR